MIGPGIGNILYHYFAYQQYWFLILFLKIMMRGTYIKIITVHTGCPQHTNKIKNNTDTNLTFLYTLYCVLVHNYLINNLHIYKKYMWILMSFLVIYEVYQLYNCWNSPQYRTNFQYCFWLATRYVCSWVKQRIYNKYLKNSQLFTSKSSQSSLISFTWPLLFLMSLYLDLPNNWQRRVNVYWNQGRI